MIDIKKMLQQLSYDNNELNKNIYLMDNIQMTIGCLEDPPEANLYHEAIISQMTINIKDTFKQLFFYDTVKIAETLSNYAITGINTSTRTISISGNYVNNFVAGNKCRIFECTDIRNNRDFTIVSSSYNGTTTTQIVVKECIDSSTFTSPRSMLSYIARIGVLDTKQNMTCTGDHLTATYSLGLYGRCEHCSNVTAPISYHVVCSTTTPVYLYFTFYLYQGSLEITSRAVMCYINSSSVLTPITMVNNYL